MTLASGRYGRRSTIASKTSRRVLQKSCLTRSASVVAELSRVNSTSFLLMLRKLVRRRRFSPPLTSPMPLLNAEKLATTSPAESWIDAELSTSAPSIVRRCAGPNRPPNWFAARALAREAFAREFARGYERFSGLDAPRPLEFEMAWVPRCGCGDIPLAYQAFRTGPRL
jgi:hypothetical protein